MHKQQFTTVYKHCNYFKTVQNSTNAFAQIQRTNAYRCIDRGEIKTIETTMKLHLQFGSSTDSSLTETNTPYNAFRFAIFGLFAFDGKIICLNKNESASRNSHRKLFYPETGTPSVVPVSIIQ